jgi:glycosyltransferase involved in cell wall biosynthesis
MSHPWEVPARSDGCFRPCPAQLKCRMRLTVVITTYNQPKWLELVLLGYARQTHQPWEILIADDGSDGRTAETIERARREMTLPVRHVWHEDQGFRKCRILNRAIEQSSGDALLFTDGDCIPRADFLAVHHAALRPGMFLSGGYIKLPEETSLAITAEAVRSGNATRFGWLRAHGAPLTRSLLRLQARGPIARALDALTPTRASFNGHNATSWREDIFRVNGFDERMAYGGLDREIGERLENAGVRGVQVRHRAHVVHLHHAKGYKNREALAVNRAIRDETARTRRVRTETGIV